MRTSLIALRLFVIILKEKQNYSFALVWLKDVVSFVSSSIDAPIAAEKDVVFHAHHSSTNRNVKTKSNYQLNADLFNLTFEICPSRGFIPHLNGLSRSKLYNSFTCIRVFFFVYIYMYLYNFTFEFISIIRVSERQNFCLGFHEIDYCKSSFINLHLGSLQIRSSYLLAKKQKNWLESGAGSIRVLIPMYANIFKSMAIVWNWYLNWFSLQNRTLDIPIEINLERWNPNLITS